MKKLIILFAFYACLLPIVFAQLSNVEKSALLKQEDFRNYYLKNHYRNTQPKYTSVGNVNENVSLKRGSNALPKNISVAGEFEEMQAIFVNWPYISYDTAGNMVELTFDDYFLTYDNVTGKETLVKVAESIPDTFSNSPMPIIYRQLIHFIEKEAIAYINIYNAGDSGIIKTYMASKGIPLTRYKFLVHKGNSIWYRDCGPVPFYYGLSDSIGFLNFEYYGGRPLDDDLPLKWGQDLGYPVFTNSIEYEGGNMLVDAAGTLFTSSAITNTNGDTYGQVYLDKSKPGGFAYKTKTPLNKTQLADSFKRIMNLGNVVILPSLIYDGGTGHIDLYADMSDDGTIITSDHPAELNKTSFPDYAIVSKNVNTMRSTATNNINLNFQNYKIPFPTRDDGTWYLNGSDYENYTRTYSNHLVVNKSIIQPIFSDQTNGNATGDNAAIEAMKKQFPGYKIWPIDMRAFDGYGGLIHCITMHLPVENPIRILHYPIRNYQPAAANFYLTAIITNKSGIQTANCKWRMKGSINWNTVALSANGSTFTGSIPGNVNAFADSIEYYIEAISNNGKTIQRPITAPEGYYTFFYGLTVVDVASIATKEEVVKMYPNPAQDKIFIEFKEQTNGPINVTITDALGRDVMSLHNIYLTANQFLSINTENLTSGCYMVMLDCSGIITNKKLIID